MEIVEELKTAVIELVHSARELETINQGNEKLVDNALSLADMTLKALVGRERSSSKSHTAQNVDAGSSFVNRVV